MSCTLNLDQVDGALSSSNLLESKNKTTLFCFANQQNNTFDKSFLILFYLCNHGDELLKNANTVGKLLWYIYLAKS